MSYTVMGREHLQNCDVSWAHELPGKCSAGVLACEFTRRLAGCSCWRRDAAATRSRDGYATRFMESHTQSSFVSEPFDRDISELNRIAVTGKTEMAGGAISAGMRIVGHEVSDFTQVRVEDGRPVQLHFNSGTFDSDLLIIPLADWPLEAPMSWHQAVG